MADSVGFEVEGLSETLKGLDRFQKGLSKDVKQSFKDAAVDIRNVAWRRMPGGVLTGKSRNMPRGKAAAMSVSGGSNTRGKAGGSITLNANKWHRLNQVEFGDRHIQVPVFRGENEKGSVRYRDSIAFGGPSLTRPLSQPTTSDPRKGSGGYMLRPAMRQRLPFWDVEIARRITALNVKTQRRAGVDVSRG